MNDFGDFGNGFYRQGWVCPKCGRCLSPDTTICPCYSEKGTTIGTGTSVDYLKMDWTKSISRTVEPKENK